MVGKNLCDLSEQKHRGTEFHFFINETQFCRSKMNIDSDIDDSHMDDDSREHEIPISRYEILTTGEIVKQMESAITEVNTVFEKVLFYKFSIQNLILY